MATVVAETVNGKLCLCCDELNNVYSFTICLSNIACSRASDRLKSSKAIVDFTMLFIFKLMNRKHAINLVKAILTKPFRTT